MAPGPHVGVQPGYPFAGPGHQMQAAEQVFMGWQLWAAFRLFVNVCEDQLPALQPTQGADFLCAERAAAVVEQGVVFWVHAGSGYPVAFVNYTSRVADGSAPWRL